MKDLIPRHTALVKSQRVVPYLAPNEVKFLAQETSRGRQGPRDSLLIVLLFQTGLRISEALGLTPSSIQRFEGKPVLSVIGKGRRLRMIGIPERLAKRNKGTLPILFLPLPLWPTTFLRKKIPI